MTRPKNGTDTYSKDDYNPFYDDGISRQVSPKTKDRCRVTKKDTHTHDLHNEVSREINKPIHDYNLNDDADLDHTASEWTWTGSGLEINTL